MVLLTAALLAALLRSDAARTVPRPLLAYVGGWTATSDKAFASFMQALRQRQPGLLAASEVSYLSATPADPQANAQAIQRAVARRAALIIAPSAESLAAARVHAQGVPVLFSTYMDPLRQGVVRSIAAAGWPATGLTLADELDAKRLEILRDALPTTRHVAVLADRWFVEDGGWDKVQAAAQALGFTLSLRLAHDPVELTTAMSEAAAFDAWYVPSTYIAYIALPEVIATLARAGRAAIYGSTAAVAAGGQLGYEQDTAFVWDALADMAARIVIEGEAPGSIPLEHPRRFTLAVRALHQAEGPRLSDTVFRRADKVFR